MTNNTSLKILHVIITLYLMSIHRYSNLLGNWTRDYHEIQRYERKNEEEKYINRGWDIESKEGRNK
jgi:hypothetical protein